MDNEGNDLAGQLTDSALPELLSAPSGFLHGVWDADSGILKRFQTFIDWSSDAPGTYCLELSFFPDEIRLDAFSVRAFYAQVENWRLALGAQNYFVRYENASWELYDTAGSGVIYTRDKPPLW